MPRAPTQPQPPEAAHSEALRRFKADIFQVLGHQSRIHIVECLRTGELSVGELLDRVPVEPANLSQHLSVLKGKRLVLHRKEGNQVFYRLRDPLLTEVLDTMKLYFQKHLGEALDLLREIEEDGAKR